VLHLAEISGPAKSLLPWVRRLSSGGELLTIAPGRGAALDLYSPIASVDHEAYEALTLPRGPVASVRLARRMSREVTTFRRRIRAFRPDLVVVATSTVPSALLAARRERVPAIAYVGEVIPTQPGLARAIGGRSVAALTHRVASTVVCCSQIAAGAFPDESPKVHIVSPGPDGRPGGDGEAFRHEHGLDGARPCVVSVGNLSRRRGQDVLLHAIALARRQAPEIGCAIVGAPHPRSEDLAFARELSDLSRRLGLESAVSFTGFVDGVADAYAAADVVVNPILSAEGLGRVALEALAAGRPVVASRVGGVSEAVRDGCDALLVTPGDAGELAEAIVRLASDRELADRLVASGQARIAESYSAERGAERFGEIAAALLKPAPRVAL
jgi:glycosyltransferase involved in cell wall biosynthesis